MPLRQHMADAAGSLRRAAARLVALGERPQRDAEATEKT